MINMASLIHFFNFLFPLKIKLNTLSVSYKSGYTNKGLLGLWWREWNSFCFCELHWWCHFTILFSRFLWLGVDIDAKWIHVSFKLRLLLKNVITEIQSPNIPGSREWIFCCFYSWELIFIAFLPSDLAYQNQWNKFLSQFIFGYLNLLQSSRKGM